jgi:ferredoxin--NADP+ reductase
MEKRDIRDLLKEPCGLILAKKQLAPLIYELTVHAPAVVHNASPGQFVIVYARDEKSKPIPLTIADYDRKFGNTISLVVQAVKTGTMKLLTMNVGDTFHAMQGPLGHASEIKKYDGKIVFVIGGVGVAPAFPVLRALHEAGNQMRFLIGVRSRELFIWEEKIKKYVTPDVFIEDGIKVKYGELVSPALKNILTDEKISHVFAAGPLDMLSGIAKITRECATKNISSAVSHMLDGTGMCGGCQCNVGKETVLLCQKGPEIDGNLADWNTLNIRLKGLKTEEDILLANFKANDPLYQVFLAQEAAFQGGAK